MAINLRVLQLGKYWHKDGGIETHVKTLCKGLAGAGVQLVNLVSAVSAKGSRFEHDGYTVVESPSLGVYFSTSMAPHMMLDARRLHADEPFDLVHLHFPDPMSHLVSMALPSHIPRVITWHSDIIKQRYLLKLYRPFQRRIIEQSKAIVAATPLHFSSSTQIPIDYPASQRYVIPFGFDFDWLSPTPKEKEKANAIRQQAHGRFVVFAMGRHVTYKGFGVLIDAIRHTQAFLVLGGEGPLTAALKAQVQRLGLEQQVFFTGRLPNEDMAAHYHACDAFCLPSVTPNEAFGIVQIEAMACGKPVVCTQLHNGVNDINPHGVTGLTVPVQDPLALASAINQLSNDEKLCKRLGNHGQMHALHKFSVENMVGQHLALYRQVYKKSKSIGN
jgi:glycosyltransferase involved in cell wall biosynthesis